MEKPNSLLLLKRLGIYYFLNPHHNPENKTYKTWSKRLPFMKTGDVTPSFQPPHTSNWTGGQNAKDQYAGLRKECAVLRSKVKPESLARGHQSHLWPWEFPANPWSTWACALLTAHGSENTRPRSGQRDNLTGDHCKKLVLGRTTYVL